MQNVTDSPIGPLIGGAIRPSLESMPTGSKPLRILQIFSRYKEYGGEEGSVYRIADALHKGFDVGFFLYSTADLFSGGLVNRGIGALKAFANWTIVDQFRRLQQIGQYDCWLIHNVFPAMSPSVYELAFDLGVPVIQYLHNYRMGCINGFFLNHGEPCQRCMHGNFLPALQTACWRDSHLQSGMMAAIMMRTRRMDLFTKIHHWIAISEAQKLEHVRMGIPAEKITVIPHFFTTKEPPEPYPEQGDVLFIGRLSPEKGVNRLLRAWSRVQHLGRTLWIVGDGPESQRLKDLTRELSLRNVQFTGFLEKGQTRAIWEKAACSVVPSIWKEPFGMVVLEAWARGRPVVAHRLGALPEIIRHDRDGFLVTPDHPEELAEAILEILEHPDRGESMGKEGFRRLEHDFSQDLWFRRIRGVFSGLTPGYRNHGKPM